MEQELTAGLGERKIAEFVQDQEVQAGDQVSLLTRSTTLKNGPGGRF
jgi:hypothetical protein